MPASYRPAAQRSIIAQQTCKSIQIQKLQSYILSVVRHNYYFLAAYLLAEHGFSASCPEAYSL